MAPTAPAAGTRSAAVAELFGTLEDILINYQAMAEADRHLRWAADADRITGEVARCLSTARVRIARTIHTALPAPPDPARRAGPTGSGRTFSAGLDTSH